MTCGATASGTAADIRWALAQVDGWDAVGLDQAAVEPGRRGGVQLALVPGEGQVGPHQVEVAGGLHLVEAVAAEIAQLLVETGTVKLLGVTTYRILYRLNCSSRASLKRGRTSELSESDWYRKPTTSSPARVSRAYMGTSPTL